MKLTGENRSTRGETCPSVTLSTTNPTWTDPGSKSLTHAFNAQISVIFELLNDILRTSDVT
jgi:hypothetical protein